ncbi:hypothetical protein FS819_022940 [Allorhizobium sp. Av2]
MTDRHKAASIGRASNKGQIKRQMAVARFGAIAMGKTFQVAFHDGYESGKRQVGGLKMQFESGLIALQAQTRATAANPMRRGMIVALTEHE